MKFGETKLQIPTHTSTTRKKIAWGKIYASPEEVNMGDSRDGNGYIPVR
jgi:hypothetical protein